MQLFVDEHRALILRFARAHVSERGEKIAAEDVAREMELLLVQAGTARGLTPEPIVEPETFLRALTRHAAGRARRRRALIEQLAAGDDLEALSTDLKSLDADLDGVPAPMVAGSSPARATLEKVKGQLSPRDSLVFALIYEDDATQDDAARTLGTTVDDIEIAVARILEAADKVMDSSLLAAAGPSDFPRGRR